MKKVKSIVAFLAAAGLIASLGGCGQDTSSASSNNSQSSTSASTDQGIKEFTMYIAMPGTEVPKDNRI